MITNQEYFIQELKNGNNAAKELFSKIKSLLDEYKKVNELAPFFGTKEKQDLAKSKMILETSTTILDYDTAEILNAEQIPVKFRKFRSTILSEWNKLNIFKRDEFILDIEIQLNKK